MDQHERIQYQAAEQNNNKFIQEKVSEHVLIRHQSFLRRPYSLAVSQLPQSIPYTFGPKFGYTIMCFIKLYTMVVK